MANGNGTSGHEQELVNVQDLKATLKKSGNKGLFNTATCSTAAGTAAKTVNAPLSFSLEDGAKIIVEFINGITVANATLQVGETAAKPIYFRGAPLEADVVKPSVSLLLSYNGTVYNIIGSISLEADLANEKMGNGIGTCSTSSGSALAVTLSGYRLVKNGFVAVTFANDVPANATLNINSRGAKPIIYKGTAIEAGIIKAGDTALLAYDGTNYVLVSGGGESVTGTIIVNLEAYVNDAKTAGSELVGVVVTLTYTSDSEVVDTHTIASGESSVTFRGLAPMKNYTVSVSGITGYTQPAAQTISSLGIGATVSKTFKYESDEYTVSISSNQGAGDTAISSAKVTISGTALANGGKKKVAKGTSISPTASAVTNYSVVVSTSGKNVDAVYSTEVLTVTCSADDSSSVAGQTVTINGTQHTLDATGIVTVKVPFGTQYSVVAGDWSGYTKPATQTFTASLVSRNVSVVWTEYRLGVFIESTDHRLYTSSQWPVEGKTANAIVIINGTHDFRMAITSPIPALPIHNVGTTNLAQYTSNPSTSEAAVADFNGATNTSNIIQHGMNTTNYAAPYCNAFTFPDGSQNAYFISAGQLNMLKNNDTEVDACLSKVGLSLAGKVLSSSTLFYYSNLSEYCLPWILVWNTKEFNATASYSIASNATYVLAVSDY